jgi:hypothetical protein
MYYTPHNLNTILLQFILLNIFMIQGASILSKKGETRWRLPLQVNSSDFRQNFYITLLRLTNVSMGVSFDEN